MTAHELSMVSFVANSEHNSQRLCPTCNIEKRDVVSTVIRADGIYDVNTLLLTANEEFDYEEAIDNLALIMPQRNGGQLTEILSVLIALLREKVLNFDI